MSRLLTWLMAIAAAWLLLTACSPTKQAARQDTNLQVLKDQFNAEKQAIEAKAVADYISVNPCIYPVLNLDSICQANYKPAESGVITQYLYVDTGSVKVQRVPTKVLVPYLDNRALSLANDSITALRLRLTACEGRQQGVREVIKSLPVDHWKLDYWFWVALGLFLAWVIYIVIKLFGK